jgi:hypothetical protein
MNMKALFLDVVENGSACSLVDDAGFIWATGGSTHSLLREAGFAAHRAGYDTVVVGAQTYDVDRLVALD